jgi:hypothetical protein
MNFKMVLFGFVVAFLLRVLEDTIGLRPNTLLFPLILTLIGYEMMRRWRRRGQ